MPARIIQVPRKRECHNGAHLIDAHGSGNKSSLFRGEDVKGTGWRRPAARWKYGVFGKQNSALLPAKDENVVSATTSRALFV